MICLIHRETHISEATGTTVLGFEKRQGTARRIKKNKAYWD